MGQYRARRFRLPVTVGIRLAARQTNNSPSRRRSTTGLASYPIPLLLAVLLVGFGAVEAHSQSNPAFVPRDESPEDFAPGPGREEAFYACTACHNFKLVAAQGLSRERWDDTLTFMTTRHNMPALAGDERRLVLDYLETAYPPRAPAGRGGWQNPFAPR